MYLYIDTTHEITIGLLNSELKWVEYEHLLSKKSSAVLHHKIFELLAKHSFEVKELEALIYSAGPGSYTGMRVSEGIKDIIDWQGIKVYSFYHFNIPQYLEVPSGTWMAKAFKGEFFVFRWQGNEFEKSLVKESEIEEHLSENLYSSYDDYGRDNIILTKDMIYNNPEKVFQVIVQNNLIEELYYFRSIENEFSRKK